SPNRISSRISNRAAPGLEADKSITALRVIAKKRNKSLRTMRLIIRDRFPKLVINWQGFAVFEPLRTVTRF
ncbi:MAG TPA: hypothetical protein VJU59_13095, partial [Paraburkholderia sp.]|uniref:hypothetical protein n=1 Tax=Paraburkholderia sp. TaxID=1926495 RepID=UPI002B498574